MLQCTRRINTIILNIIFCICFVQYLLISTGVILTRRLSWCSQEFKNTSSSRIFSSCFSDWQCPFHTSRAINCHLPSTNLLHHTVRYYTRYHRITTFTQKTLYPISTQSWLTDSLACCDFARFRRDFAASKSRRFVSNVRRSFCTATTIAEKS